MKPNILLHHNLESLKSRQRPSNLPLVHRNPTRIVQLLKWLPRKCPSHIRRPRRRQQRQVRQLLNPMLPAMHSRQNRLHRINPLPLHRPNRINNPSPLELDRGRSIR